MQGFVCFSIFLTSIWPQNLKIFLEKRKNSKSTTKRRLARMLKEHIHIKEKCFRTKDKYLGKFSHIISQGFFFDC